MYGAVMHMVVAAELITNSVALQNSKEPILVERILERIRRQRGYRYGSDR